MHSWTFTSVGTVIKLYDEVISCIYVRPAVYSFGIGRVPGISFVYNPTGIGPRTGTSTLERNNILLTT